MRKVISLFQPYASAIFIGDGLKKIETRGWSTNFRGSLLIHATLKPVHKTLCELPRYLRDKIVSILNSAGVRFLIDLPHGAIIGSIELIDCVPIEKLYGSVCDTPRERALGDWSPGRFGWIIKNPIAFEKPIPAKGHQGFWNWEGETNVR